MRTVSTGIWLFLALFLAVAPALALTPTRDDPARPSDPSGGPGFPAGPVAGDLQPALPLPKVERPLRPVGGRCPEGWHLLHEDGTPGVQEVDDVTYSDADYICRRDESLAGLTCSGHGTAVLIGGLARCGCDDGYAGAECQTCAPDHETGRSGGCEPKPPADPNTPVISGLEDSIEWGQVRTLSAASPLDTSFVWEVVEGGGCLLDPASGCGSTAVGPSVDFQAPTSGDEIEFTRIRVTPACCSGPSATGSLPWTAPSGIPVSGYGDSRLQPIVKAVRQFMRHRCVGAGVVGVSRYGSTLGVWGLGHMNGRASLGADPACGNDVENPYVPLSGLVRHDTPFRLASVSKAVTAAILRETIRDRWEADHPGDAPVTDAMIEDLQAFAPNNPIPLFPEGLRQIYRRLTAFPVAISDSNDFEPSDEPTSPCADLPNGFADPKWPGVRVGHFLGHQSGLQRNPPDERGHVTRNIAAVRDLTWEQDFVDQEQVLINEYGQQAIDDAKAALGWGNGDGYFVPMPTRNEMLTVTAGRCTRHPVGVYHYSNVGVAFWQTMIEQAGNFTRFAADNGDPATHQGSALQSFFQGKLGIATTSSSGIFRDQTAEGMPGYSYRQPRKRDWISSSSSYYPPAWDNKRPHCAWDPNNDVCDFDDWNDANPGRINWGWDLAQADIQMSGISYNPGGWALAAEARTYLKFMGRYWVGGYSGDPIIGERRNNVWDRSNSHSGSWSGTKARAMQIGSDTSTSFSLPPRDGSGNILDDFDNLVAYKCALPNGTEHDLPDGVDIFIAFNTSEDKKCEPNGDCKSYHGLSDEFVKYGVCRIEWATINGANVNIQNP